MRPSIKNQEHLHDSDTCGFLRLQIQKMKTIEAINAEETPPSAMDKMVLDLILFPPVQ